MNQTRQLVLGLDGGGSKTVAWLADASGFKVADADRLSVDTLPLLGCGSGGPSNCRSVGLKTATHSLRQAIDEAFADAGTSTQTVASVCFALAGADRQVERTWIERWASEQQVATQIHVCNDAVPLLYAVTIAGPAVAVISGTGSLVVGRSREGQLVRCGGWGGLIGDEGSGYRIAIDALQAAARHNDERGPTTQLHDAFLERFELTDFSEMIPVLYDEGFDRRDVARLASLVFDIASKGDDVAQKIIAKAAHDLAQSVITVAKRMEALNEKLPIGLAGGVLIHQTEFVQEIARMLADAGLTQTQMQRIEQPVQGAVRMAALQLPSLG